MNWHSLGWLEAAACCEHLTSEGIGLLMLGYRRMPQDECLSLCHGCLPCRCHLQGVFAAPGDPSHLDVPPGDGGNAPVKDCVLGGKDVAVLGR